MIKKHAYSIFVYSVVIRVKKREKKKMLQYDNRIRRAAQISPLKLRRVCLDPPWRSAQFVNFYSTGKKKRNGNRRVKRKKFTREKKDEK